MNLLHQFLTIRSLIFAFAVVQVCSFSAHAGEWKGTVKVVNESGSIGEMHLTIRGKRVSGKYEILKDQPIDTARVRGRIRGRKLNPRKKRQSIKISCRTFGNFRESIEMLGRLERKGKRFVYKGKRMVRTHPNLGYSEPNHFIARIHWADGFGFIQLEPDPGESISEFQAYVQSEFNDNPDPSAPYSHIQYIPTDANGKWSYPFIWKARTRGTFKN